jgi:hypothetical protein
MEALLAEGDTRLLPRLLHELCPDAAHGWIRASVVRSGWD